MALYSSWHRSLGSRLESAVLNSAVLEELKIRVVSFDRPGYGQSSPHTNRSLASFAGVDSDARSIAYMPEIYRL